MSAPDDEFEAVRHDPDLLRRGQRATTLISIYQQRATELARLRREAIEELHRAQGMSYTEIAQALGITKGRVTQIRAGAPPRERAFFGIGPVHVGVPLRSGTDDRPRTYVDAADLATQKDTESLLASLALTTEPFTIPGDMASPPAGDLVVICGPKSAPIAAHLLDRDPKLGIVRQNNRWWIENKITGERFGSPLDDHPPTHGDIGYLARHRDGDRVIVHVAGIHSPGSRGVLHYLTHHLSALYREVGDQPFSVAIRCQLNDLHVISSEILTGPYVW